MARSTHTDRVIEPYLAELSAALRGPRAVKTDLLVEARHSLVDATEAYESGGLPRTAAECRAVADFGAVPEIAPGYQVELGLVQARRTALLVAAVIAVQGGFAEAAWRSLPAHPTWHASTLYAAVAQMVDLAGPVTIGLALVAALTAGIGTRYLRPQRWLARATGVYALAVYGFFTVAGLFLTVAGPLPWTLLTGALVLPWAVLFWVAPLLVVMGARRCLAAA
jgi:hypothetical protein